MRILYYMPFPLSFGADRWIYEGWREGFSRRGIRVETLTEKDDWIATIRTTKPHLLFIPNLIPVTRYRDVLLRARAMGTRIFLVVHWPMSSSDVGVIRSEDVADVYFGEREPESMQEFVAATGKEYHVIANAANPRLHFPTRRVEKYAFDIVYVGAKLEKKRRMFEEILLPLKFKYRVGIFGPYWTWRDNALRAAQVACRRVGAHRLAGWINRMRIQIPAEEENEVYSSAKVCVNFHEREADGSQPHYIVNQRAFKIPACGGFELCDYVPALRKYFEADEVVMAKDKYEWFAMIEYYVRDSEARERVAKKGAVRARRDHTYDNRVEEVLRLYGRL